MPSRLLRSFRAALLCSGLWVVAACDPNGTAPATRVQTVLVTVSPTPLYLGRAGTATARALDRDGEEIAEVEVEWRSSAATIVSVDASGRVQARSAGTAVITATIEGVTGSASVNATPAPAATITVSPNVATIERGAVLQLDAVAVDVLGEVITSRPLAWSSSAPGVASVNASGLVNAVSAGTATISSTLDGRSASATVTVTLPQQEGDPVITGVSPAILLPGSTMVLTGSALVDSVAPNEVRVNGVPATITSATPTMVTAVVPTATTGCEPTRAVQVQLSRGERAASREHPYQTVAQRELEVGASVVLTTAAASNCVELPAGGRRYLVSVFNAATINGATAAARLRGTRGITEIAPPLADAVEHRLPDASRARSVPPSVVPASDLSAPAPSAAMEAHARLAEANRAILERTTLTVDAAARSYARAAVAAQTPVGTIVPMRIPNVGGFLSGGADFCQNNFAIHARVVYNGTRAIVVEDTATVIDGQPTLVGRNDDVYRAIGQEFDATMFDVVAQNFGSPLRMDDQLDGNGKVIILLSPRVNTFSGLSAFVVSCDFFPTSTFPSSNRGEVFYSVVPTVAGDGTGVGTRAYWYWTTRSTIVHETKHIASYANRIRDFGGAGSLEEAWLEEGSARLAEEIYLRRAAYDDLTAKSNATYAATMFCDVRPQGQGGGQRCVGKPYGMYRHYGQQGFYDFLLAPDLRSPLGPRLGSTDATWYASAWSLLRWAIDAHDLPEATTLTNLVRTNQKGVTNLTARIGRSWEELIGEWSLTMYLDDLPGFAPLSPRLTFASWNLGSVFAGMRADFPTTYTRSYPLEPRVVPFGGFELSVPAIGAGSFTLFDVSGGTATRQLLELVSTTGGPPPATLRVAIARLQ